MRSGDVPMMRLPIRSAAARLGRTVDYGRGDTTAIHSAIEATGVRLNLNTLAPTPTAPMAAAKFLYRPDGRPDWGVMWQDFCELARFGGPPHRGEETALVHLHEDEPNAGTASDLDDAVEEIRRGILKTTGLRSQSSPTPGWLAVECDSPKMAAWMAACILLENVDARFEEEWLVVPASASFRLKDEVKSVITVVAKVHHYWIEHSK